MENPNDIWTTQSWIENYLKKVSW